MCVFCTEYLIDMKQFLLFLAICVIPMSGMAQKGPKYAHVNSDEILQSMPDVIEGQANIRKLAEKYTQEFAAEEQRLGLYGQAIQNKDTTEAAKQKMAEDYRKQVAAYQAKVKEKEDELIKTERELLEKVTARIKAAIELVSQDEGIDYVFDIVTLQMWYYDESYDITDKVKKELGLSSGGN